MKMKSPWTNCAKSGSRSHSHQLGPHFIQSSWPLSSFNARLKAEFIDVQNFRLWFFFLLLPFCVSLTLPSSHRQNDNCRISSLKYPVAHWQVSRLRVQHRLSIDLWK